jgi:hypothetical protein
VPQNTPESLIYNNYSHEHEVPQKSIKFQMLKSLIQHLTEKQRLFEGHPCRTMDNKSILILQKNFLPYQYYIENYYLCTSTQCSPLDETSSNSAFLLVSRYVSNWMDKNVRKIKKKKSFRKYKSINYLFKN